jgi:peptidyl-prolyl cis-trans isomerase C
MNLLPALRLSGPIATARAGTAALLLAAMLGTAAPSFGETPGADSVIAVVNGTQVHESEVRLADEMIGRNLPTQDRVERREAVLKVLIDTILLSQAAKDRNIADQADLQRRMTYARNQGLMNQLLSVTGQQAVTEEAVRTAYEEVVVKPASQEIELHLRHMIFKTAEPKDDAAVQASEEKAKAALERVNKGEDFAAVVADVSEDPTTKAKGGDFDWRSRAQMGKEYAEVAFTMKKGEVSQLIRTSFGWHIIKLEDQRTRKPVDFDKIRDRVAAMVASRAQLELIDKVRAEAKIERIDQVSLADKKEPSGK